MPSRLELRALTARPHHPELQILIDGEERLRGVHDLVTRNDVADVIDTEALVPRAEPHRVALYGCNCGEIGCAALTAVVVGDGDLIRWTGFRAGAGGPYQRALPSSTLADPLQEWPVLPRHRIELSDVAFDREQYLAAIRDLAAGRPWETRTRAVIRFAADLLPGVAWAGPHVERPWYLRAPRHGAEPVIWVNVREGRSFATWEVPLPAGPVERAAAQLVESLEAAHPRAVSGARPIRR